MRKRQAEIKTFCKENNLKSPPEYRVLDLVSEVGELAKEILKMSDYGRKNTRRDWREVLQVLGDRRSYPCPTKEKNSISL
ncbi:MAG: MazG-like family protein [Euryarchaeota archaeon]|nr:MazG-like family protein [Euryarchaeota archaeon]